MNAASEVSAPGNGRRRRLLLVLASGFLAVAIAWGVWHGVYGRFHETTEDAYVAGHIVTVTAQTSGNVIAVLADDTDAVAAGATLVRLDPTDARLALEQAEAELARVLREVRGLYASDAAVSATIRQREIELERALDHLDRRLSVGSTGAVTPEELSQARDAVKSAQAELAAARASGEAQSALIIGARPDTHPRVAAAAARVKESYLAWARSRVPAPVSGQVARRAVQVGQRVTPGTPLMAIVPLEALWVDANFKESQLGRLRVGQAATLRADVYGRQVTYRGRVVGLAAGTGAAFALLPPQNATGNWIKVVQRVPVRIALDPAQLAVHPLRIGLSMHVEVDTRASEMPDDVRLPTATNSTDVFSGLEEAAQVRVKQVITATVRGEPVPPLPALESEQTPVVAGPATAAPL